ncbi:MAG: hypothetical protein AB2A00_08365 [Myxococcota bacterium]
MTRMAPVLRQPAFWTLVAVLFLGIFTWPFLQPATGHTARGAYVHLLVAWAILVALQFLMARSLAREGKDRA